MADDVEAELDEDFLFYMNLVTDTLKVIAGNKTLQEKVKRWLYRLLAGIFKGVFQKRCRNLYLANLLLSIQNSAVDGPFNENPFTADISKATEVFAPIPPTIEPPDWLNDTTFELTASEGKKKKNGRTYVATRTLPNGQGAFAYVAVSLSDREPMWLGAGESSFDPKLQEKYAQMVTEKTEMEKILARRKDPKEREKVIAFYDVLLQAIADELDGKDVDENETVEGLLVQLIHDLNDKNQYEPYEALNEEQRRMELLLMLFDRVKIRRDKVAKREEILDELEQQFMPQSFFEVSEPLPEDRYYFPATMWEQVIDKLPNKHHMEGMQKAYPVFLMRKFLQCLSAYKEAIATRMQKRHENIVSQMKKEMRKEGEKLKHKAEQAESACQNALEILEIVKEHYKKVQDVIKKNQHKDEEDQSEHTKLYEAMKRAVFDQQRLVEEEALRGKFLAHQINAITEQTEQFMQVNDDVIRKTEEANMKIMKNIKYLRGAITRYEAMINEMKLANENQKKQVKSSIFFF